MNLLIDDLISAAKSLDELQPLMMLADTVVNTLNSSRCVCCGTDSVDQTCAVTVTNRDDLLGQTNYYSVIYVVLFKCGNTQYKCMNPLKQRHPEVLVKVTSGFSKSVTFCVTML